MFTAGARRSFVISTSGPAGPVQSRADSRVLETVNGGPDPDLFRVVDNRPKVEE